MVSICPTITAESTEEYARQIERVEGFSSRIHIDMMDGIFTPNKSVDTDTIWWPEHIRADIHMMFQRPETELAVLTKLRPHMVIVHAESLCDIPKFASDLREVGVQTGVAIFPQTTIESIEYILPHIQQVLIFSGNLGYQGGSTADMSLLRKVGEIKKAHRWVSEIAWDGGVNSRNIRQLTEGGIDVLNVGGYIHHAKNQQTAFDTLVAQLS